MTLVDTHCHLDDSKFDDDREQAIERALAAGVTRLMAIGTGNGPPDLEVAVRLADRHPFIYATIGVHPHDASKATDETFARLRELAAHPKVLAIGEIGLDYHYDFSPRDVQKLVFRAQLRVARELDWPVVIHTREADDDTLRILRDVGGDQLRGVLHCFTGTPRLADAGLALGFYISLAGILTFPKAQELRDTVRNVPLDRLLTETDSPFLAPVPYRGARNEPAHVAQVVAALAELHGLTREDIAARTAANFHTLFRP
jgi:TatD DNase family protein